MVSLDVAFGELREVHLVENGEGGQLGNGVGACDRRASEQE